jgi:hypothetical protein
MKKIVLLFVNLTVLTSVYATNPKQDSIYHDLYLFLVDRGIMKKEQIPKFGSADYGEYLYIFDILKDDFPNKPNLDVQFGIYKFNYSGYMDSGYYVLIKYNDSYKVYYQTSLPLIIGELIDIRKNDPALIGDELFNAYIEQLINVKLGVYDDSPIVFRMIGNIEYYK